MDLEYLQSKFKHRLYPLGSDPLFEGVYAIKPDYLDSELIGVTAQFLEHAESYDANYFNYQHWKNLIQLGISNSRFSAHLPEVLDLGSGSGNSVLPILEIFSDARVVATDISPQLLALLRKRLAQHPDYLERCGVVCADAIEADFYENSFDIVIGGAILHHLLNPAQAIRQACTCVRPGGCAIFFEPFEFGSAVLRVAYEHMLEQKRELELTDAVADLFQRVITDVAVRTGRDKAAPIFRELDDKWLFTRTYFEEQARANAAALTILPIHSLRDSFSKQTRTYLRIVLQADDSALSARAWEVVRHFDEIFSEDLKREMLMEGCVVFQK
jgi:SAM-dependent methyltransferase